MCPFAVWIIDSKWFRLSLWFFPGFFNSGDAASSAGGGVAAGAGAAWQHLLHHQGTRRSQENTWLVVVVSNICQMGWNHQLVENILRTAWNFMGDNPVTRFRRKWWTSSDSHWPADSLLTKQRRASRCQAYRTTGDCLWKSALNRHVDIFVRFPSPFCFPECCGAKGPMNPMLMMAQMMLETQKKLKEAQEKMMKVQVRHGPRVLGSACFSDVVFYFRVLGIFC